MKASFKKVIILGTPVLITIIFIFMVPILILLDFFGAIGGDDDTSNLEVDGYVENNYMYANDYTRVANKYITGNKGYVSLERILYFFVCDDSFSFDELYRDNLDNEKKAMLPIGEVCKKEKYRALKVCKDDAINDSKQIKKYQSKPFGKPIDFSKVYVTSFFKEQRIIMGTAGVHAAWDLAASANTPVYSVCDGKVSLVSFPQSSNSLGSGYGNYIEIRCDMDNKNYSVIYGHLYPFSSKVRNGQRVSKGEILAGVGTTGRSTGNHLHYEVRYKGNAIDGMSFVNFK